MQVWNIWNMEISFPRSFRFCWFWTYFMLIICRLTEAKKKHLHEYTIQTLQPHSKQIIVRQEISKRDCMSFHNSAIPFSRSAIYSGIIQTGYFIYSPSQDGLHSRMLYESYLSVPHCPLLSAVLFLVLRFPVRMH